MNMKRACNNAFTSLIVIGVLNSMIGKQ